MPPLEDVLLLQKAMIWPAAGYDSYGQPMVSAPLEMSVRWDSKHRFSKRQISDNNIMFTATVVAEAPMRVGSIMWLGTLDEWYGTGSGLGEDVELHEVKMSDVTRSVDDKTVLYTALLGRYRSTSIGWLMAKVEIDGLGRLLTKLEALAKEKGKPVRVTVGYTQHYAIYVHENLEAFHPVGQAKFLEQPIRKNAEKYAGIIVEAMKKGRTLEQALLMSGLALQRDSQQLVPVDTGMLRASAFTRLIK